MLFQNILKRPVSVIAIFLSVLALGVYGWIQIPVTLLPDVDPVTIKVEVRKNGVSSGAMESTVMSPLRQSFIGAIGLTDIKSRSVLGFGQVVLTYEHGTHMDLAVIELNEKIDRIVSSLPPDMDRPLVRQNKPTDIPIVNIHVSSDLFSITELSEFARFELTKRLEQIGGVSRIEVNGTQTRCIRLMPKSDKIMSSGLDLNAISTLIEQANLPLGQILVKDGNYEYLVQIENLIKDKASLEAMTLSTPAGQKILLKDLFTIQESFLSPLNRHVIHDKRGLLVTVHNQSKANLYDVQEEIYKVLDQLRTENPDISFVTSEDQVDFLKTNIYQLYLTSGLAICFAFLVFQISSKSRILPVLIGLIIPSSLIIAIGTLWFLGITLNIITLSGFILGIGLLVDNMIVLIEEVNQHRSLGLSVREACIKSITHLFPALLSSTLTTICVFIPLLALRGIASELFKEQAIALVVILACSLILSFSILPTLYIIWVKNEIKDRSWIEKLRNTIDAVPHFISVGIMILVMGGGVYASLYLKSENLPNYEINDFQIKIVWNEPISLDESERRIRDVLKSYDYEFAAVNLGINDFAQQDNSYFDQAQVYFQAKLPTEAYRIKKEISQKIRHSYPKSAVSVSKAVNSFEMIFVNDDPPAEARIRKQDGFPFTTKDFSILTNHPIKNGQLNLSFDQTFQISLDKKRIENTSIPYEDLYLHLKNLASENFVTSINSTDQSIPLIFTTNDLSYFIKVDNNYFDLATFYNLKDTTEIREITADLSGPYLSFTSETLEEARSFGQKLFQAHNWIYDLEGTLLDNYEDIRKLILATGLAIILLYLVLVAQFESFKQPLIIFTLIPLAALSGLLALYLTGATLNIMSFIGLIVMLGIIVNDSILKVDSINRNIKLGMTRPEAVLKAKHERFKPILMTSLSTILALIPIFLTNGMASDLQKPLAIVVISGLIIGTWSSMVLLPKFYLFLYKSSPRLSQ